MVKKNIKSKKYREDSISNSNEFRLEKIEYVPYIFGWIFGILNILFWAILLFAFILSSNRKDFMENTLHKIVYVYGIVVIILILIALLIFFFVLLLGITIFGNLIFLK